MDISSSVASAKTARRARFCAGEGYAVGMGQLYVEYTASSGAMQTTLAAAVEEADAPTSPLQISHDAHRLGVTLHDKSVAHLLSLSLRSLREKNSTSTKSQLLDHVFTLQRHAREKHIFGEHSLSQLILCCALAGNSESAFHAVALAGSYVTGRVAFAALVACKLSASFSRADLIWAQSAEVSEGVARNVTIYLEMLALQSRAAEAINVLRVYHKIMLGLVQKCTAGRFRAVESRAFRKALPSKLQPYHKALHAVETLSAMGEILQMLVAVDSVIQRCRTLRGRTRPIIPFTTQNQTTKSTHTTNLLYATTGDVRANARIVAILLGNREIDAAMQIAEAQHVVTNGVHGAILTQIGLEHPKYSTLLAKVKEADLPVESVQPVYAHQGMPVEAAVAVIEKKSTPEKRLAAAIAMSSLLAHHAAALITPALTATASIAASAVAAGGVLAFAALATPALLPSATTEAPKPQRDTSFIVTLLREGDASYEGPVEPMLLRLASLGEAVVLKKVADGAGGGGGDDGQIHCELRFAGASDTAEAQHGLRHVLRGACDADGGAALITGPHLPPGRSMLLQFDRIGVIATELR